MTVLDDPVTMLLRLSRASFWLAAAAAALGLVAPAAYSTPLLALVSAAGAFAFGAWRAALRAPLRPADAAEATVDVPALETGALQELEAELARRIVAAPTFEAALHAVAQLLRGELGAHEVAVHAVGGIDRQEAWLHQLVAAQPGFRAIGRRVRLDDTPLGRALADRRPSGAPPQSVVLPVCGGDGVVAVIEFVGFELTIEAGGLARLLTGAGAGLAQRAAADRAGWLATAAPPAAQFRGFVDNPPAPATAPGSAARDDVNHDHYRNRNRNRNSDDLDATSNPEGTSRIMLRPHLRAHAAAADAGDAGSALPAAALAPGVLDPAALARLAELDPSGTSRLLERVLTAFQASVARLRPQAEAARRSSDRDALRLVAHTLKSSSASIGALHLSQLCAQIEAKIRAGDTADLEIELDALDGALDAALAAIAVRLEPRE